MSIKNISKVDDWQKERQKMFKSVPTKGKTVQYLGKKFLVYKNTFWPFNDSQPLVKNFKITRGESVLDIGTGSGVIAIFACYRGASRVMAVDINPAAVRSARHNVKAHGFNKTITVEQSNLFQNVGKEKFDVITANLPFRDKPAHDIVAESQWDTDLKTNKKFFKEVKKYLKPKGRVYFAQSNFGAVKDIKKLARKAGFSMKTIGRQSVGRGSVKTFYAFVLKPI